MQLALTYNAASVGADDWAEIEDWFRRAVGTIGEKEVAFHLDIKPSNLSDALFARERKDIKAKWVAVVLRMAPEPVVREYLEILCRHHSYEAPKRIRPKTAEERERERQEWLAKNAPAVLAMMQKEIG